jgi:hypothetical protein
VDISLDEEIKRTEAKLEQLWKKDQNAVFHCPKFGGYFVNLGNYKQLKMCGKCFTREKTKVPLDLEQGEIATLPKQIVQLLVDKATISQAQN